MHRQPLLSAAACPLVPSFGTVSEINNAEQRGSEVLRSLNKSKAMRVMCHSLYQGWKGEDIYWVNKGYRHVPSVTESANIKIVQDLISGRCAQ